VPTSEFVIAILINCNTVVITKGRKCPGESGHQVAVETRQILSRFTKTYLKDRNRDRFEEGLYNFYIQFFVKTFKISQIMFCAAKLSIHLFHYLKITGMHNVIELAKQYKLRIFIPSTIGAFGPDSGATTSYDLRRQQGPRRALRRVLSLSLRPRLPVSSIPRCNQQRSARRRYHG